MGPLSRDSGFNMEDWTVKIKVGEVSRVCLKCWLKELEMPDILWPSVIEGILKTQVKLQCKEWVHFVKPNPLPWEILEVMFFTNSLRFKIVRGAPAHLKSFSINLYLVPGLRSRDTDALLDELNAMDLIGPWSSRARWQHWITKVKWLQLS